MTDVKAPVVLFAYKRTDHLHNAISSLEENASAKDHDLYIFSDAPKGDTDAEDVAAVRKYLDDYVKTSVFANCTVTMASEHKGLAASVIGGVSGIIKEYGWVITVEDDLTFSPYFLDYMQGALDRFEKDPRIWAVSGYTPALNALRTFKHHLYLNYRPHSWGWATWYDRWKTVDWDVSDYNTAKVNPLYYYRMCRGGNTVPSMLRAQMRGELDSWYIRWCYNANKCNRLTVYPARSFVRNTGFDESATHTGADMAQKYDVALTEDAGFDFDDCVLSKSVNAEFKKFHSMSLIDRVREKL